MTGLSGFTSGRGIPAERSHPRWCGSRKLLLERRRVCPLSVLPLQPLMLEQSQTRGYAHKERCRPGNQHEAVHGFDRA